jgi:hypothetical protein
MQMHLGQLHFLKEGSECPHEAPVELGVVLITGLVYQVEVITEEPRACVHRPNILNLI